MTFKKLAYLTIDDSPSSDFLEKLNYLEKKKIPTIFFCIGNLMENRSEEMVEAIQRGFTIANHSYAHPHFSKISLEKCQYEIEKTDEIIEQLYQQAGKVRTQKWFRFPYGDKGDLRDGQVLATSKKGDTKRHHFIQAVLQKLEYTQPTWKEVTYDYMEQAQLFDDIDCHWTFDIMEWATKEYQPTFGLKNLHKVFQRLDKKYPRDCRGDLGKTQRWLQSNSAEIILLHDHEETTPIFKSIIDRLLEYPLEFVEVV